ncbi:hypothetical protein A2U01_0107662, partial [Trifolium medium]|nr:hypothetical protein [Trifolium medium]
MTREISIGGGSKLCEEVGALITFSESVAEGNIILGNQFLYVLDQNSMNIVL